MFFTNAPIGAMVSIIARVSSQGFLIRDNQRLSGSSAPERSMPMLSANIAATVIVASLLKPLSASSRPTMRRMTSSASTTRATRSMRIFSLAKAMTAAMMIATVAQACHPMRRGSPWMCGESRRRDRSCRPRGTDTITQRAPAVAPAGRDQAGLRRLIASGRSSTRRISASSVAGSRA